MVFGAEGILIILMFYAACVCLGVGSLTSVVLGSVFIWKGKKTKVGIFWIAFGLIGFSPLVFLWVRDLPKKSTVVINLSNPLDKAGIPLEAHWLKNNLNSRGEEWFCEVRGRVALTVILPDGRKIEGQVSSILAEYNSTNGFYHLQIDDYEKLNRERALIKLRSEISKWSLGATNLVDVPNQQQRSEKWIWGDERARSYSFFAGVYFLRPGYSISTEAIRDYSSLSKCCWRYEIEMSWAIPKPYVQ